MAKRATARRFPVIMTADEIVNAQHHAMASRLDRTVFDGVNADESLFDMFERGVSGETTDQVNTRLPVVLDKDGPFDIVIILGGTNDLGVPLDKNGEPLFRRLRSLHELALQHSPLSVAVTIPETGYETVDEYTVVREKRLQVNALLKNFVQQHGDRMLLSDLATKLPPESLSDEDRRTFWADHLHFSLAGYDRMGATIFEDIRHRLTETLDT
ncbi:hypothetical protein AWC38_SpisGene1595 [Stylophora pistillata]|uniref:SGNH hydrolase-type esterase domain-containing protein n=1 Tax=Stylophora pistillata TaxID=50429 RepID=A0A2B4SS89_STYPI|nr:hypothetical protein AWC38_SpisGene1595 [Stylophora pistillata]